MTRVHDILHTIGQAQYITTLDLVKYREVPIARQDKEKTAFTSPTGLFQFTVMPFHLSGAPAIFQSLMDQVVRGLENFVSVYLDDIVIFSATWSDHLQRPTQVFEKLQQTGLSIKLTKCHFTANKLTYLGHSIGNASICPGHRKIKVVQEIP